MTRQYIDDYLQDNHISVAESIDISNMDLLIDFAKIGVGVACVIKKFCHKGTPRGISRGNSARHPDPQTGNRLCIQGKLKAIQILTDLY